MFAKAMETITQTWNGAVSLSTPDPENISSGRLALFFKTVRGISDDQLYLYLEKSFEEDMIDTFILAFNTRDCRGGKGEREIGRKMLVWLFMKYTSCFSKIFHLIPEYGRWDDLLIFFPNILLEDYIYKSSYLSKLTYRPFHKDIQNQIVSLFVSQLKEDKIKMHKGKPVSICAKWCPSEGDSKDKKFKLVKTICDQLEISPREYRVNYISPLRQYLDIVERYLCSGNWDEIKYEKVPSCAMKILKKAFEKHSPEYFNEWKTKLQKGETKVNAKQLFPYQLIKEIREKGISDVVCEEQWKVLEKEIAKLGNLTKALVVVDVSGSMCSNDYLPIDIATSLGILVSHIIQGEFHNHVISFSDNPSFLKLRDTDLNSRLKQLMRMEWGMSTNIQKVFDLILNKGKSANLKQEDMPDKIFIVSDMQFNSCQSGATNFQEIERKYTESGYKRPQIIFWNVNGSSKDFPISVQDDGTCLVAGASPSILKSILYSSNFSPYGILRTELDSDRYKEIRTLL